MSRDDAEPIGRRVHVLGNSSTGKSTLGERLAGSLGVSFVELDALNWQPDWVGLNETDPAELERRFDEATSGEGWVAAGSYSQFAQRVFWPRLETVVFLDLPVPQLLWRVLRRSWRRWRTKELLWGTNYEKFWAQLKVWSKQDSLIWWIVTQQKRKRNDLLACAADPRWAHIRFVRLTSTREIDAFARALDEMHSDS
jgi:adenylate kinase family enzyme